MGLDKQGIRRGSCSRCGCKEFAQKPSSVKCNCGHAPTAHIDLATGAASGSFAHHVNQNDKDTTNVVGFYSTVSTSQGTYGRQPSLNRYGSQQGPRQPCCHICNTVYPADVGACPLCFIRDNCPCGHNMKFCDPNHGVFPYCSPSCRDKFLLPEYNKKLQNDLKITSSHIGSSSTSVEFSSTTIISPHTVGTSVDDTGITSMTMAKQSTVCLMFPKFSCAQFYNDVWSDDGKYGLYISGLVLGETTELRLADVVFAAEQNIFNIKTDYNDMISKCKTAKYVRVFRKYDFEQISEKTNREGKATNCDAESQIIAFFLLNTSISGIALTTKDHQVFILGVDEESIAGRCGIRNGDIIRSIGSLYKDKMDEFKFKQVTKEKHVTSTLAHNQQPSAVIGSVLIIERPKMTYV